MGHPASFDALFSLFFLLTCSSVLYRRGRNPGTCSGTGVGQEQGTVQASERKGIFYFFCFLSDTACKGRNSIDI